MDSNLKVTENERFIATWALIRAVRNSCLSCKRVNKDQIICFSFYKRIFRGHKNKRKKNVRALPEH